MAMRATPFAVGEWYHCYNRGVEKRRTFEGKKDYDRFMHLLYLSNSDTSVHRSDFGTHVAAQGGAIYSLKRGKPLVAIGAYTLMPNHFHLLFQEIIKGGISAFMQKLGTAYTMYFNIKNQRAGGLFIKPFRSKHVHDDEYLQYLVQYIHLNSAEIFESGWKHGKVKNLQKLEQALREYPYGSFVDYAQKDHRPEVKILYPEAMEFLGEDLPSLKKTISVAAEYYVDFENPNHVKASP